MLITVRCRTNDYQPITTMKTRLYNLLGRVYMRLSRIGKEEKTENRVYDHLGMIDTLGFTAYRSRLTSSYSCEMGYYQRIYLPFNYMIELIDESGFEKEIYIGKRRDQ